MGRKQVRPARPSYAKPGKGSITAGKEILQESASRLFERVAEETLHGDRALFDSLTEHERRIVIDWMSDAIVDGKAENARHDVLWEVDFVRKPVDIQTFVHDDFFFGRIARDLHPRWKEDLYRVFAPDSQVFEWVMTGAIGIGKGHPVDSRVATPHGWKRVGDLRVGDAVVGSTGTPTRVKGVFPRGTLAVYRVRFDDGAEVVVDGDHLWAVRSPSDQHRDREWKTRTTRELFRAGVVTRRGAKKWHIPVLRGPAQYAPVSLPLSPYAVGALIGDGGLTGSSIRFSTNDAEILEDVCCELGLAWNHIEGCDYRLVAGKRGEGPNPVLDALRELGLTCRSEAKRIPNCYLRGSVKARIELLRGLMDTDGWCQNEGKSSMLSTASSGLADDIVELVRSLGGTVYRTYKETTHLPAHILHINVTFNPFRLTRKAARWCPAAKYPPRRMIASIRPEPELAEVVCIQVEAQDQLYAADHFVVTHNTTLAGIGLGYKLYRMSCLRDPARYYGLLPGSQIIFGVYSITKRQVADTGYNNVKGYVDTSPYFRQQFPRSTKIDSKIDFYPRTKRRIQVIPGSTELHALGLNLFAFLMDEVNFMRVKDDKDAGIAKGQAYDLYNATYTRLLSRFTRKGGTLPGMMFLLSSRNAETSFLEEHLRKVKGSEHSHSTHVSDYALWEVKNKQFTWPGFQVEVGDRVSRSRLLKDGEKPRMGARVVEVPWEFRKPFTEDVDQALRDIAGVATFNLSPLISDRPSVFEAVSSALTHPFSRDEITIDVQDDTLVEDHFVLKAACCVRNSKWGPRLNPVAPRYIHVDIGLTNDCLGLAMGHVAGKTRNERVNPDGTISTITNPYIVIDMMLRVRAMPGGEVDLSKIRAFILYLRNIGYPVMRVTFDQFQSADSIQILKKEKFDTGHQSVDKKDTAYLSLRSAFFDRRVATYGYKPFEDEVLDLQRDVKKRKVDHPQRASNGMKGSKDVSDAVAGVIWLCTNDERALHASMADIEFDRTGPARTQPKEMVTPSAPAKRVGAGRTTWDELRANIEA